MYQARYLAAFIILLFSQLCFSQEPRFLRHFSQEPRFLTHREFIGVVRKYDGINLKKGTFETSLEAQHRIATSIGSGIYTVQIPLASLTGSVTAEEVPMATYDADSENLMLALRPSEMSLWRFSNSHDAFDRSVLKLVALQVKG